MQIFLFMTTKERRFRRFSEELKRDLVVRIERGELQVSEIARTYEVSRAVIYQWKKKYGKEPRGVKVVVEKDSAEQQVKELKKALVERDLAIAELHMKLRYKEKVIELANKDVGYDIEKKTATGS